MSHTGSMLRAVTEFTVINISNQLTDTLKQDLSPTEAMRRMRQTSALAALVSGSLSACGFYEYATLVQQEAPAILTLGLLGVNTVSGAMTALSLEHGRLTHAFYKLGKKQGDDAVGPAVVDMLDQLQKKARKDLQSGPD